MSFHCNFKLGVGAMGDVIQFDCGTYIIRDDVPPHMDDYGRYSLLALMSDLVKLRDNAASIQARSELDAAVKKLGRVLARYEPEGAA